MRSRRGSQQDAVAEGDPPERGRGRIASVEEDVHAEVPDDRRDPITQPLLVRDRDLQTTTTTGAERAGNNQLPERFFDAGRVISTHIGGLPVLWRQRCAAHRLHDLGKKKYIYIYILIRSKQKIMKKKKNKIEDADRNTQ